MRPKILVTLLVIANAATAQAQELINVHFSSGYYDMTGAAVLGSPGDSWNGFNVMAPSYSMNYTSGSLIDSTGSSTTATLTMSGWEGGPGGGCPSVDNLAPNLFSSYIYTNYSPATSSSLSFSGLAAKRTYQLIFYTVNYPSLTGRDFTCTINGITETLQQNSYGTYTSNPVSPGVCSGNYLAFTATTDASGNLNISFASAASPTTEFDIAGLQIQEQPPVTLPIEVMGPANTSSTVTVAVPSGASATSLWMQVHGSSYANKMSVSINCGAFTSLSNSTSGLTIADPERSYGGIGSNYPVMEMTLALPPRAAARRSPASTPSPFDLTARTATLMASACFSLIS